MSLFSVKFLKLVNKVLTVNCLAVSVWMCNGCGHFDSKRSQILTEQLHS